MAPLPARNLRHTWLRFKGQDYTDVDIQDFEERLGRIFDRQILRVRVLDFDILTKEMNQALTDRLRIEHTGVDGKVMFTSYAWRQLFGIHGPLVRELILEFFSTFRFGDSLLTEEEMDIDGFRAYWIEGLRDIDSKLDFRDYSTVISSAGDFLSTVTSTDLFFLRIMDEGTSMNFLYLLAYYIFIRTSRRRQGARMSGGHFIARLGVHCRVITKESLRTLTVEDGAVAGAAHINPKVSQEGAQADPAPMQPPRCLSNLTGTLNEIGVFFLESIYVVVMLVKMDDTNINMKEYIRLEEEKAHRHGKVYNWETAKYGKIWYDEDFHDLRSIETEFPAIVFNDALTSEVALSCEPMISPLNDNKIDYRM
nr:hypothetical protein [Tanacetum cinerariifolium]